MFGTIKSLGMYTGTTKLGLLFLTKARVLFDPHSCQTQLILQPLLRQSPRPHPQVWT